MTLGEERQDNAHVLVSDSSESELEQDEDEEDEHEALPMEIKAAEFRKTIQDVMSLFED